MTVLVVDCNEGNNKTEITDLKAKQIYTSCWYTMFIIRKVNHLTIFTLFRVSKDDISLVKSIFLWLVYANYLERDFLSSNNNSGCGPTAKRGPFCLPGLLLATLPLDAFAENRVCDVMAQLIEDSITKALCMPHLLIASKSSLCITQHNIIFTEFFMP